MFKHAGSIPAQAREHPASHECPQRHCERLDGRFRIGERPLDRAQIAAVLAQTRAAGYEFELDIFERRISIWLKIRPEVFVDSMRSLADMRYEVQSEFLTRLGIEAKVQHLESRTARQP